MKKQTAQILFATILALTALVLTTFTSCVSRPRVEPISRTLYDSGIKNEAQLTNFFMDNNSSADKKQVKRLANLYIQEGLSEGINSDCAFVQMCLETGFLKFGGLVTPEMHNYCGLGSMDSDQIGRASCRERV